MKGKGEPEDFGADGCLKLFGTAIRHCFRRTTNKVETRRRINFANSDLLKLFCFITKMDFNKIKNKIIKSNT